MTMSSTSVPRMKKSEWKYEDMKKHQKKRNVGLLYEFLTMHAAEGLVAGDDKRVRQSLKLLRRHFREGTELNREFRLFNALANTFVVGSDTAERIVQSAKEAARRYDAAALDREKSLLIRSINHTFDDPTFYDKRFEGYRTYATIQMLLNEWREPRPTDVVQAAQYEATLVEHLQAPKEKNVLDEHRDDRVDDLVVDLMVKKLDGKYKGVLNEEQMRLMNAYVGCLQGGDDTLLRETLAGIRGRAVAAIDAYLLEHRDADVGRLNEVRALATRDVVDVDDRVVARHLRLACLNEEILGGR